MSKKTQQTHADQLAFWKLAIETWQDSGVSVRWFCRQEGLSEPSFYTWRKKITQHNEPKRNTASATNASAFIEVAIPKQTSGGLELIFASGHTLRIGPGTDRQIISKVVDVLQEAKLC
jgi:transposase